ncbi:MAG: hypothetical protein AAF998_06795 [Bacteroidota bacterium]
MKLTSASGRQVILDSTPMAQGGEGAIHRIEQPATPLRVAKIFHDQSKAVAMEDKLNHLCQNSPIRSMITGRFQLIWPEELLFENGTFVGYWMSCVQPEAISLSFLTLPISPAKKFGKAWQHYDQANSLSRKNRLEVCLNLAKAIKGLTSQYTLLDLKPDNVLVMPDGGISLIDLDSVQVAMNSVLLFPAGAVTPDYAPREFHTGKVDFTQQATDQSWTVFSFAVIVYEILLGIHPFAGAYFSGKYSKVAPDIPGHIAHGLYPNGRSGQFLERPPAPPHLRIDQFPPLLRRLWIRAFDDGTDNPRARPSIPEWIKTLQGALSTKQRRRQGRFAGRSASTLLPNSSLRPDTQLIIQ